MPFIDVKISKKITECEAVSLKTELGKMIEVFPGKTENWLMCNIDSDNIIWFKGDNSEESAFVEVKLFGNVCENSADRFTALLCDYFENKLGIPSSRIYVRYEGGNNWGWNGSNF